MRDSVGLSGRSREAHCEHTRLLSLALRCWQRTHIVPDFPTAPDEPLRGLPGSPAWLDWLVANITTANPISFGLDIDDSIIIPPGGYLAVGATASQGGALNSFMWEELAP